jgi:SAM-dependent methyltransferase
MKKSRSFDRAADYYDRTRQMPGPIETQGIPAIQQLAGSGARILEVGAGTGRISIPLMERGANVVGCDLSSPMLHRFQEKYPAPRLVQADASRLPFSSAQFDAVLTVHVLHLVPVWREVLREIQRVLVPGGIYLNVRTWDMAGAAAAEKIREFWRGWMKQHGVDAGHPGLRTHTDLLAELRSLGAAVSEVEPARYTIPVNIRKELENFAARIYSETWDIPDAIFNESMDELRAWASREFGDIDQEIVDEARFVIHVARFGGADD